MCVVFNDLSTACFSHLASFTQPQDLINYSKANPISAQDVNRRQMCSAKDPSDELSFGADRVIARLSRCVLRVDSFDS